MNVINASMLGMKPLLMSALKPMAIGGEVAGKRRMAEPFPGRAEVLHWRALENVDLYYQSKT
ncbi:MAG: hypothetical protein Q8K12_04855 [Thiobacillus sp.]|nr:hypothetical protein [Thiobacillus sp.]